MENANNEKQIQPTQEMIEFFERRTKEHITRVASNLNLLAQYLDNCDELLERAKIHDASKFSDQERIPYVWLTEFHRCRRNGKPFEYPNGIEEQVKLAIDHHVTSNRHHYEFHSTPDQMTEIDLIEMVCDWTAMSQEFNQEGGSAQSWAEKTIGTRVDFNDAKKQFIYKVIAKLDKLIKENNTGGPG